MPSKTGCCGSPLLCLSVLGRGWADDGSVAPLPLAGQAASWSSVTKAFLHTGREQHIPSWASSPSCLPGLGSGPGISYPEFRAKVLSNLMPKFSRSNGSTSLLLPSQSSSLPPSSSNALPAAGAAPGSSAVLQTGGLPPRGGKEWEGSHKPQRAVDSLLVPPAFFL